MDYFGNRDKNGITFQGDKEEDFALGIDVFHEILLSNLISGNSFYNNFNDARTINLYVYIFAYIFFFKHLSFYCFSYRSLYMEYQSSGVLGN